MKVYFSTSFNYHKPYERACEEEELQAELSYNGMYWVIPKVYTSPKGIVLDICRQVPLKEYEEFYKKYKDVDEGKLSDEEQEKIVNENPLGFSPDFRVKVNGEDAENNGWSGSGWIPSEVVGDNLAMQMEEGRMLVDYYGLDRFNAWQFFRLTAKWPNGKQCDIESLELTISVRQKEVQTGVEFETMDGCNQAVISFVNPIDGQEHKLCVEDTAWQEIPKETAERIGRGDFIYPRQYMAMSYSVQPEISEEYNIQIRDCGYGDNPIWKEDKTPSGASSIALIGGIHGAKKSICSHMYFEKKKNVRWGIWVLYTPCRPECFKLK